VTDEISVERLMGVWIHTTAVHINNFR